MTEAIESLLLLQDKDQRIANLRNQIDSVPEEKERIRIELQGNESEYETAREGVIAVEKSLKTLELDIDRQKTKIRDAQTKLTQVKKNEEYKALIAEIEAAKLIVAKYEDQQIVVWEQLEAAKVVRAAAEKIVNQAKARIQAAIQDLDTRLTNCAGQVVKLEAQRAELAAKVPPEPLNEYERTIQRTMRNGGPFQKGLVPVVGNTCMGCSIQVTPATCQKVSYGTLVRCDQCGSLLYDGN